MLNANHISHLSNTYQHCCPLAYFHKTRISPYYNQALLTLTLFVIIFTRLSLSYSFLTILAKGLYCSPYHFHCKYISIDLYTSYLLIFRMSQRIASLFSNQFTAFIGWGNINCIYSGIFYNCLKFKCLGFKEKS